MLGYIEIKMKAKEIVKTDLANKKILTVSSLLKLKIKKRRELEENLEIIDDDITLVSETEDESIVSNVEDKYAIKNQHNATVVLGFGGGGGSSMILTDE